MLLVFLEKIIFKQNCQRYLMYQDTFQEPPRNTPKRATWAASVTGWSAQLCQERFFSEKQRLWISESRFRDWSSIPPILKKSPSWKPISNAGLSRLVCTSSLHFTPAVALHVTPYPLPSPPRSGPKPEERSYF